MMEPQGCYNVRADNRITERFEDGLKSKYLICEVYWEGVYCARYDNGNNSGNFSYDTPWGDTLVDLLEKEL